MTFSGDPWRLGHRPALDGVRGIAIILVLACHTLAWPLTRYGDAGVDLFFALSGFLITSLLLEEQHASGGIAFKAFYKRRAARLLPALVVYVVAVTGLRILLRGESLLEPLKAAAVVLGYVSNWATMGGMDIGFLGQTWSLAIEEQFYIVWPLTLAVLLLRLPRTATRLWVCGVGILLLCAWREFHDALLPSGESMDHSSLGRAAPLLIGCAVAFYMSSRSEGGSSSGAALVFTVTLLAAPWIPKPEILEHLDSGLVAAGLILCVARGQGVRWLEWGPLRLVGQRSYGLYLWHYPPMIGILSLPLSGWSRVGASVLALAISWILTLLSWHFVERPFLRRRIGRPSTAVAPPPNRIDSRG